jgi:hypothetical protein
VSPELEVLSNKISAIAMLTIEIGWLQIAAKTLLNQ